jgi:hypothetical protein
MEPEMSPMEIRNWIQFLFVLIGGSIGLFAFIQNMNQRKIENAIKMTKWFHESITKEELESWQNLFFASSDSAGAKQGCYKENGIDHPLSNYFSEGSPDSGNVGRVADCLEVICHELCTKTVDPRFVWFELGQLLRAVHFWLSQIESPSGAGKTLLESSFPSINKAFKKFNKSFIKWPSRTYVYVE